MDKDEYFERYKAFVGSSDDEEDTDNTRQFVKSLRRPKASFWSISERRRQSTPSRKAPGIHRATSAPEPSLTKEAPQPLRKFSLLCYDTSTLEEVIAPPTIEPLSEVPEADVRPVPERSTSTPNIGSVIMTNSTGINSMLKKTMPKKRKREESFITLVSEDNRVFADQVFFWIPPDDKAPLRKIRINNARSYGATWTKEWISNVTHIVVEKSITFQDVVKFLTPILKTDILPPDAILVNEEYTVDCIQHGVLFEPKQRKYTVKDLYASIAANATEASQASDTSLQIKQSKTKMRAYMDPKETPPRSPILGPRDLGDDEESPGVLISTKEAQGAVVESPAQSISSNTAWRRGDDLDDFIAIAIRNPYLGDEEDDNSSEDSASSESEREKSPIRAPKKASTLKKGKLNHEEFSCMKGGTGVALEVNPNKRTIEILDEMGQYYQRIRDQWRPMAYRRAVGVLKAQTWKVMAYDEALKLRYIGKSIAAKIQEIALTDRLRKLEYAKLEPTDQLLVMFLKIYGVGLSQAWKWILAGHTTLDDLKTKAHLTDNQRLGLEHYDDFTTRIPREEVATLGDIVKAATVKIDSTVQAIVMGSYRRGAVTSGDIDLIFTKSGTISSHELLPFLCQLVNYLTKSGFLVAALAEPSRSGSGSKWHGACVIPGTTIWRRIDFLLVPESEMGAALIYFTGDDIFNRSIRLLAQRKGWRLNQCGLYKDVLRGSEGVKLNGGTLIESADEKEIFKVLGVPWRPPEQRICS